MKFRSTHSARAGALLILLLGTSLTMSAPVEAQRAPVEAQRPFTPEDALEVRSLSVQSVTRDGRFIAATISTHRDRLDVDHMRYGDPTYVAPSLSRFVVIDTDGGAEKSLFDHRVQLRAAEWSPDGRTLAFLLLVDGVHQLHSYDRRTERVRQIRLSGRKPIASGSPLVWRPDGSGVIVTLRSEDWADRSRKAYEELTLGPIIVQDSREPFLAWEGVRGLDALQLPAIVSISSGAVRELLPESRISGIRQSRDGSFITYVETTPVKTAYSGGGAEYELFLLDLALGESRSIIARDESRPNPQWHPRGDVFAYAEKGDVLVRSVFETEAKNLTEDHRGPVSESDTTKLRYTPLRWSPEGDHLLVESKLGYHRIDPASGGIDLAWRAPEEEKGILAPNIRLVEWSPDGRYLFMSYSAQDRWERGLLRHDLDQGESIDLVKDGRRYSGWTFSRDGTRVLYSSSDGDSPDELWTADSALAGATRLTDLNPWLADRTLTRSELVDYLDVDGNRLYGILYYPVGYREGEKYPLVAEIYESFFENGFNMNMNLLANAGFFGFRPSAKLETGFPGEGWLKGVTAGINTLIERGMVDGARLGVQGTSYGGYATNLLITQTNRFAAAINISGKVNMVSFLGDSPKITTRNYRAAETGQDRIGATLWEQPHKYLAHSAVMNADRITTPLLMLTGEGDWNVPATNQREMYYALRRLDKTVVWVHYMDAGHGAGRSGTVADFHDHWSRVIGWYREHFAEADASDPGTEPVVTEAGR